MDDKFYIEILEENKAAVREKVKEAMLESIKRQFEWEIPNCLKEIVTTFVKEEIAPEVKKELMDNKEVFIQGATDIIKGVPAELGKAIQEHLAKNLTNSWNLKKITDALFS